MASIFHGQHKSNTWASQWTNTSIGIYHIVQLTFPPHIKNKPWISRKDDKFVKIKIKKNIMKRIEGNTRLRVRVRVRFISFYSELAPTDPWCNMLQTLLGRKKYEKEMSDEEPLILYSTKKWRFQKDRKTSRKAKRIINFLSLNAPVKKQKCEMNILKLKDFIMLQNILFVKGCINENAPDSLNDKFHPSKLPLNDTTRSPFTY